MGTGIELTNSQTELQKREYELRCNVIRKTVNYLDVMEKNQHRAELIILDPWEGTERDMLFTAWLDKCYPDANGVSKIELPVYLSYPVGLQTKVRFCWPDAAYHKPYFLVLSLPIEVMINANEEILDLNMKVFRQEMVYEDSFATGMYRG